MLPLFPPFLQVYYNNALSLPPLLLLVLLSGELRVLPAYTGLHNPEFQVGGELREGKRAFSLTSQPQSLASSCHRT